MPTPYDPSRRTVPSKGKLSRVMSSMRGQKKQTQICPDDPRLDGKWALVTGGSGGIGEEIVKGLAARGANVIVAARGNAETKGICRKWGEEAQRDVSFLPLDLGDVQGVREASAALQERLGDQKLDIVCANAGISPNRYGLSVDGYERAFAVNCLGHHVLLKQLIDRNLLADGARIVGTTGDIYTLTRDCTSDYKYRGRTPIAYARSKLGNLWQFGELARRYPEYTVITIHPGVVASGLEGSTTGLVGFIKRRMMASPAQGAQASLIAATQDMASGSYFHNMHGLMELSDDDPARDEAKASAFWELLEELAARRRTSQFA